ncbi:MAG: alpha/beta hydrolase [Comamonas sp. SCN 65-56]|uniref:alpha/beta fold hydrolase n=1 Tax=Comamonas sp. SCN 65-56 TaxID=1660095 RepID=UPI00086BAF87|nr:alpha/beta hydrolase [Comamonas sp. SCN 65-56]ODS91455.1 MAG: alpha/beta hydrolase [Comamonas sp. SCN 65-56]
MSQTETRFAEIAWRDRPVRIEYQWLAPDRRDAPLMVFLHEGLGSVAMWKDFPAQLCDALQWRGLVYSRPGYGRSTPRAADEHWVNDFMHRQADEVLPAFLSAVGVTQPPWLFGHSDGASIALLHARNHPAAGAIVLAPHTMVEQISVDSIEKAREAYVAGGLRERLARYHDDVDSAFWGWNEVWLSPAFRAWDIQQEIAAIGCPVLAIQGLQDEYGTLAHVRSIARQVPQTQVVEIDHCGHSPHRDQPAAVITACSAFVQQHSFSNH